MYYIIVMNLLIDVRSPEEFEEGHAEGAINLPINDIARGELGVLKEISKDVALELYCHSGTRSEWAKELLINAGFKNVRNSGGIDSVMKPS